MPPHSFQECEFETIEADLTPPLAAIYDAATQFWAELRVSKTFLQSASFTFVYAVVLNFVLYLIF